MLKYRESEAQLRPNSRRRARLGLFGSDRIGSGLSGADGLLDAVAEFFVDVLPVLERALEYGFGDPVAEVSGDGLLWGWQRSRDQHSSSSRPMSLMPTPICTPGQQESSIPATCYLQPRPSD